ncbi:MAG: hypothetical protein KC800_06255 [Candidatus Eremiobacteraeota bacterium]|nr:hypothetical protein [Candidatus Eremiobacteraeota bacterium]
MSKCSLVFLLLLIASATPATADSPWAKTLAKMTSREGYALNYSYEGPEGKFLFQYIVQGAGSKILTEVLEGSARGSGTRIYYEPAKDKDNVFMETAIVTLRRSLEARDIKDSSLYQPLFAQIVGELPAQSPSETLPFGEGHMFVFGKKEGVQARVTVDAQGNPTSYRRLEKGKDVKKFTFSNLDWGFHSIDWKD